MKRSASMAPRRRRGLAARVSAAVAVATAVALLASACGSAGVTAASDGLSSALATPLTAAEPLPGGVTTPPVITSKPAATPSCPGDGTASFRPDGPLPAPGKVSADATLAADPTMAKILRRGYLIAGVDENTQFFGYRDPSSGKIVGFDIDLLHQISQAIFGEPNKIQYVVITSAERIPAITSGQVDIVADSMTENCDRWQSVDFSTDYLDAGQEILVNRYSSIMSDQDVGGRRLCAAGGTTSIQTIAGGIAGLNEPPIPVSVPNWTDCLVMLEQGQVDGISTDDSVLIGLEAQDPNTTLIGPRFTFEPHGIAMSKTSPEFVRFVNAVLEQLRTDGMWTTLYTNNIGNRLGPIPAPPAAAYRD